MANTHTKMGIDVRSTTSDLGAAPNRTVFNTNVGKTVEITLESVQTPSCHSMVPRHITSWADVFGDSNDELGDDAYDISLERETLSGNRDLQIVPSPYLSVFGIAVDLLKSGGCRGADLWLSSSNWPVEQQLRLGIEGIAGLELQPWLWMGIELVAFLRSLDSHTTSLLVSWFYAFVMMDEENKGNSTQSDDHLIGKVRNDRAVQMQSIPSEAVYMQSTSNEAMSMQGLPKPPSFTTVVNGAPSFAAMINGNPIQPVEIIDNSNMPTRKGNFISVRVNEVAYKERINLCQFSLIARVVLSKGEKPWKYDDLYLKLQNFWKLDKWKLISLGRMYFHVLLHSKEDRKKVWSQGSLNLKPGHSVGRCHMVYKWVPPVTKPLETSKNEVKSTTQTVSSDLGDTFDDLDDELSQRKVGFQRIFQEGSSLEDVRILLSEEQIISVNILMVGGQQVLSFMCGHVFPGHRKKLWADLRNFADSIDHPWAVIENFNAILGAHERSGGGPPISSSCSDFRVAMEAISLLPIDMHRAFLTWVRRGTCGYVQSKLDRFFCNDSCLEV
ncbi:hypothetical protein FNV43_RR11032 [Rhamnella rubrinervis]|uniref:Uncharacterized protein n=1 Tax=Rhamnella rubrinervis TaxID=2594499 RepID=A0A8K0H521_9ROSA|nr:hypothetical protein FNV43_RR11032 [Rhamnella rubrinervis]